MLNTSAQDLKIMFAFCAKIFMASRADSWENHLLNGFDVTGISWCGQKIKADKYLSAVNERYRSVHWTEEEH